MGGTCTYLWKDAEDKYRGTADPIRMQEYEKDGKIYMGLAAAGYALGGAAMVAGVVMWAIAPPAEKKVGATLGGRPAEIPVVMPAIGAGTAGFVVNGVW
jgi:hypothetical protein